MMLHVRIFGYLCFLCCCEIADCLPLTTAAVQGLFS